jgi:antitoxin YefM
MHSVYRINTNELDPSFIDALKVTYPDKEIEIVVYEVDETAYLLGSEANKKHLLKAIKNVKDKSNLVEVDIENLE